jgi:hypothetical protein
MDSELRRDEMLTAADLVHDSDEGDGLDQLRDMVMNVTQIRLYLLAFEHEGITNGRN